MLNTRNVLAQSGVKFGTSGARGLVEDFSDQVCAAFTHAFLKGMTAKFKFESVAVGVDNRPSSPAMAGAVLAAIQNAGFNGVFCGVLPTPALAFYAMDNNMPCIMVTGSHIPFDRNGLKFYRPDGEITKSDELSINEADVEFELTPSLTLASEPVAMEAYKQRYQSLFGPETLRGKKIGIYEHSSAGRDLYADLFTSLGAEVVSLGRTDEFVPIDTEAVSQQDKQLALDWSSKYSFDAIFSTDGDGDRPLIADENGNWLRGDILGLLTAKALKAQALAVPVSCNTAIEKSMVFETVVRTKIGSPYVIAEFEGLAKHYRGVSGFEANGGFLLGSETCINDKTIKALPTRDALLPALMLLVSARCEPISQLVKALPTRFTDSDRIKNFATEKSQKIILKYRERADELLSKLQFKGATVVNVNTTDGLRIELDSGDIIHLRPSGNAPELRCYAESENEELASSLVRQVLSNVIAIDC